MMSISTHLTVALGLVLSLGCSSFGGEPKCEPRVADEIDSRGQIHQWVVDTVHLPSSADDARELAVDLDDDGRADNALGWVLGQMFSTLGTDVDAVTRAMIADGRVLHLIELYATSLDNADGVAARLFLGQDADEDLSNNLDGTGSFTVEAGHPVRPATGVIGQATLDVELGFLPLRVVLPTLQEPLTLELQSARIVAQVTEEGISGVIAGVISESQYLDEFLPSVYAQIESLVARDCSDGECEPDTSGAAFADWFDDNRDGFVSDDEFFNSPIFTYLTAPDLDIYDDRLRNNPGCDGVKESLSIAVGFTAVRARFESPGL